MPVAVLITQIALTRQISLSSAYHVTDRYVFPYRCVLATAQGSQCCLMSSLACRYYTEGPASASSPRILSLNDDAWTFKLYERPENVPATFFQPNFDPSSWDKVYLSMLFHGTLNLCGTHNDQEHAFKITASLMSWGPYWHLHYRSLMVICQCMHLPHACLLLGSCMPCKWADLGCMIALKEHEITSWYDHAVMSSDFDSESTIMSCPHAHIPISSDMPCHDPSCPQQHFSVATC